MEVSKNIIYIRADGSSKIGLGHLVRCLALAHMLKEAFLITFVSQEIPENLKAELNRNNFLLKIISCEEDFFTLLSGDEIVVLDHYKLDSTYQKRIKNLGNKLVCIDDLHDKEFFADLIINHSPGIVSQDYKAQEHTKYALGPEYALLRPVFIKGAGLERRSKELKNVLICFGGSDFKNLTRSVLKSIIGNENIHSITVILGAAYPYKGSIDQIIENSQRVKILSSLSEEEMFSNILNADLAIIPSSGILYEVIAGGCIPLICYYAENQRKLFNYFKEREMLPSFNAMDFNDEELNMVVSNILNQKIKMDEIPFRREIRESSSNNLKNFKQLLNE